MALSVSRFGNEFVVNTQPSNGQRGSWVAQASGGGFVVAWNDLSGLNEPGPASLAVAVRIFDSSGAPIAREFRVNTQTVNNQNSSSVAHLDDGNIVVVWDDENIQTAGIKGQLLTPGGVPIGGEFAVNTVIGSFRGDWPTVAALNDGGFVVTYEAFDGNGPGIRARAFPAIGPAGAEFIVNVQAPGLQERPKVTVLANGNFVIVWDDDSVSGGDANLDAVKGRILTAAGAPVSDDFLVNTTTTKNQTLPSVTALSDGSFVVVWMDNSGTGADTVSYDIKGQIFSGTGGKIGGEFTVNTETTGLQNLPVVAALIDGAFVVAWGDSSGIGGDPNASGVKARVFEAGGAGGSEFLVNSQTTDFQENPSVAALDDGSFVITWTDRSDQSVIALTDGTVLYQGDGGPGSNIKGQIYSIGPFGGSPQDDQFSGSSGADRMSGREGSDLLDGGAGNDLLNGGPGSDQLAGREGNDLLDGGGRPAASPDYLYGGVGNDTYHVYSALTSQLDIVDEGEGNPTLPGAASDVDTIISHGDFFWDFYSVGEIIRIATAANSLYPTGTYLVGGKNTNAQIFGNAGTNIISTYGGSKTVDAGGGTDAISFSLYDLPQSFDGVNTLLMRPGAGIDYLYNFTSNVDKVDLRPFNFGISGDALLAQAVNVDPNGVPNSGDEYCYFFLTNAGGVNNFVAFVGLTSAQLHAGDFIMA